MGCDLVNVYQTTAFFVDYFSNVNFSHGMSTGFP